MFGWFVCEVDQVDKVLELGGENKGNIPVNLVSPAPRVLVCCC